jgi:hypothetical protein
VSELLVCRRRWVETGRARGEIEYTGVKTRYSSARKPFLAIVSMQHQAEVQNFDTAVKALGATAKQVEEQIRSTLAVPSTTGVAVNSIIPVVCKATVLSFIIARHTCRLS